MLAEEPVRQPIAPDEAPNWMVVVFKSGQIVECTVAQEVLDRLSADFAAYCSSGNPRGGWYDVRPDDRRQARLFLPFENLLYIG
jgi:hypothetical protein